MTAEEAAGWVEIIKAVGTALGVLIGAVGLAYGRIAAKQAKQAVAQTASKPFIGGQLKTKSVAATAEQSLATVQQALDEARQARAEVQALLDREKVRGAGARRADTNPQPEVRTVNARQPDTQMLMLNPPSDAQ